MTRLSTPILGSGSSRLMQDDASKYREVYGRINEIVLLSLAVFPVFHRVFYETRYMTRVHTLSMNYLIIEGYISSLSHPLSLSLAPSLSFSLALSFSLSFGLIRVKDVQRKTPLLKCRLYDQSDVPRARSISPAAQSSPSPRPRPPPTGSPVASDNSPSEPPRRGRRGDPLTMTV